MRWPRTLSSGPSSKQVSASSYVHSLCASVSSWGAVVKSAERRVQDQLAAPPSVSAARTDFVHFLNQVAGKTTALITSIDHIGTPKVQQGKAIAQYIHNTFQKFEQLYSKGSQSAQALPSTPSPALRERHPQVTASHKVCLTFRDNGNGMDEEVRKRIFEPFYTTKALGHGTGLGLAMVHAIMKGHKGAIVVESSPETGTNFGLYFPAAGDFAADSKPGTRQPFGDQLVAFGGKRKILLVDDEEPICKIGAELLERLGFSPATFQRPADALGAFQADPSGFCAVISDLTMPEMTGLELARQIRGIRPAVPIILTSGYLHLDAQQKARESGVNCVINKPFEMKEMAAQIRAILGESADGKP